MSRIGTQPIPLPKGVSVQVADGNLVTVKGPKGELFVQLDGGLGIEVGEEVLNVTRPNNDRHLRSQHGLARTLLNNSVVGVTNGHAKTLEIVGVGYRAALQGTTLTLNMGYSHPVVIPAIPGVTFQVLSDEKTRTQQIVVSGIDKAVVGQVAADIRKVRKPDPYKGKGIRYRGEVVRTKAGKRAGGKK
ncbi:MAG: 50S ribosomal protein L6 [Fimbriimonadaceae bacterium]